MSDRFEPSTLLEQLMFGVKRIEGMRGGVAHSYGTGWTLRLEFPENSDYHLNMLVTNRHVLEDVDEVRVLFHTTSGGKLDGGVVFLAVPIRECVVDSAGLDLALILFGRALNEWIAANPNRGLHWTPLGEDHLITVEKSLTLDVCEPILMVGCPSGLWDEQNGFPLFRRGVTASHPAIDFNGRPEFAIDIGVYSGSSGSPVMLWDQGAFRENKNENNYSVGFRFWLLGTLWGGPRISEAGELRVEPVPTDSRVTIETGVRMHLGYVIKACEVLRLAKQVRDNVATEIGSKSEVS